MKGHVSYKREPLCGIYIQARILHLYYILFILIHLLLNIFTIHKCIIAYCPIYTGYLHSEPAWFTTDIREMAKFRNGLLSQWKIPNSLKKNRGCGFGTMKKFGPFIGTWSRCGLSD
jgi:hypothetical protein